MTIFSDLAQVMQNARTDAKTLDNYIHGAADTKVTSRLGKQYWTLATLDNKLSLVKIKAETTLADIDTLAKSTNDALTAKSNSANAALDSKAAQANSDITAKVVNANAAIDSKVAAIDTRANNEIANLQSAINTAVAASAGANGWDTTLVEEDGLTQRVINSLNVRCLESVSDLSSIKNTREGQIVFVKSYYAGLNKGAHHRIYRGSKSTINNGTTVINGWEIYFSNVKYISTDMIGLKSGQSCVLQIRSCLEFLNTQGGGTLNIEDGEYLCEAKHLIQDPLAGQSTYRYWFAVYSNMTIQGSKKAVLKAEDNIIALDKDNNYAKGYQFFVDVDGTNNHRTDLTIKGFTLDANGQNNLLPSWSDRKAEAGVNFVALLQTNNATIDDMAFKNNPGAQPIVAERNCRNFILRNCTFNEMGMNGVGNIYQSDHSTIYIVADGYLVQNNRFVNSVFSTQSTALELHGNNGLVTGNYVENYYHAFIHAAGEINSVNINIFKNTAVNVVRAIALWAVEDKRLESRFIDNNITFHSTENDTVAVVSYNHIPVTHTGRADFLMSGNTFKGNNKTRLGHVGRLDTLLSKGNTFYDFGSDGYTLYHSSNSKKAIYDVKDKFVNCKLTYLLKMMDVPDVGSSQLNAYAVNILMSDEHLTVDIDATFLRHQTSLTVLDATLVNTCLTDGNIKIHTDNKVKLYDGTWSSPTFTFDIKALDIGGVHNDGFPASICGKLTKLDGEYHEKFKDKTLFLSRRYANNIPTVSQNPVDLVGDIVYNQKPVDCMGWICVANSDNLNELGTWKPFGQIMQ